MYTLDEIISMSPEDINYIGKLIALLMIKAKTESLTITEEDTLLLTRKVYISDTDGVLTLRLSEEQVGDTVPATLQMPLNHEHD